MYAAQSVVMLRYADVTFCYSVVYVKHIGSKAGLFNM